MNFEDAVVKACVDQFFQPQPFPGMDGGITWSRPHAASVIDGLFQARKEEILAAVIASVDIDGLAEKVAGRLTALLTERHGAYTQDTADASTFRRAVDAKVIDLLAADAAERVREQMAEKPTTDGPPS